MNGSKIKSTFEHVNTRLSFAAIFAIALIIRLIWWGVAHFYGAYTFTTYDSSQYLQLAHNVLHHGEFSQSVSAPFYPDVVRTPGYPLWLVLFGWMSSPTGFIALVQSVIGSLVPVVVAKTALALKLRFAGWAGLLLAVDAALVVFTPLVLTDGLFTLLFAVWFYQMVTARSGFGWMTAALLAGVLVLIRPSGLIIPLATFVWCGVRIGWKPFSLGVGIVALLLPFGWMLRNYTVQNTFALSTIGPNTLYLFHAAAVKAKGEDRSFNAVQSEFIENLNARFDWANDPQAISDFLAHCKRTSISIYAQYPKAAAQVTASNLVAFIAKPPRGYFDDALGLKKGYDPVTGFQANKDLNLAQRLIDNTSKVSLALSGYQFVLQLAQTVLFALGMKSLWSVNRRLSLLIAALFAYFCLSSAITQTDARFRLPVLPLMGLCWAAVGQKPESHPFGN
ncbi:MAG: hypothetical protein ACFCUH_06145 [Flavobacteriales bacterium]